MCITRVIMLNLYNFGLQLSVQIDLVNNYSFETESFLYFYSSFSSYNEVVRGRNLDRIAG